MNKIEKNLTTFISFIVCFIMGASMVFTDANFFTFLFYLLFGISAIFIGTIYLIFNSNNAFDIVINITTIVIGIVALFFPNDYLLGSLGTALFVMGLIKFFKSHDRKYDITFLHPLFLIGIIASLSGDSLIYYSIKLIGIMVIALGVYFLILFIKNEPFHFPNIKDKIIKAKYSSKREKKDGSIDANYKEKDL